MGEYVEDLRFDRGRKAADAELMALDVELAVPKPVDHSRLAPGGRNDGSGVVPSSAAASWCTDPGT
jgi:hypothetical protein